MSDFDAWFHAEVLAERLYSADEDVARRTWDGVMAMAAKDTARLDFMIANEARVAEDVKGFYHVWAGPLGDPESLEPPGTLLRTGRDAIDAAMTRKKRPRA
ncbi:hypothetical protein FVF58_42795 [Paraburkholderia panacisoli]|uniref:Uncharacterized protein n=1 Tax=Paraburkholderia panacisoli TaxID=2603818 RepID=A0A5B0G6L2_9BURK|nr:hypothetical protein [Paraburkholderia panacisoli]KAA0999044.1 hypothetical protein FVF58_42795 [Paraburkholderia panacisoli]